MCRAGGGGRGGPAHVFCPPPRLRHQPGQYEAGADGLRPPAARHRHVRAGRRQARPHQGAPRAVALQAAGQPQPQVGDGETRHRETPETRATVGAKTRLCRVDIGPGLVV